MVRLYLYLLKYFSQSVQESEFEKMIETMEKESETHVITLVETKQLFPDINHVTLGKIYDYWLNKRLTLVCHFLLYVLQKQLPENIARALCDN